jgi:hypothetical protein
VIYFLLILPFVVWVFFLAYTALKANWKTLRIEVKIVGAVVVAIGWLVDIALNLLASILMLDAPQEWTFSQKCGRLKCVDNWRADVAYYFCANWLDPFELGGHCK